MAVTLVVKHYMAIVQFILHIESLLQSSVVGSTGPGKHPFLLVIRGNNLRGNLLYSVTEYIESRKDLNTGQYTL
jgi:hypothetical protein